MPRVVLATANPHKVDEMRAIFADLGLGGVEFLGLGDLPGAPFDEPLESGTTFDENATIKARCYAAATGEWCLADDSGLEIDALDGRPGVISSHYCTDGREEGMTRAHRDAANNDRVLRELAGVPPAQRTARFVCVMALYRPLGGGPEAHSPSSKQPSPPEPSLELGASGPEQLPLISRGTFEGRIGLPGDVPRGGHGFGYDPLFLVPPDYRLTSAELAAAEKNVRSHRAAAARAMAAHLARLVTPP